MTFKPMRREKRPYDARQAKPNPDIHWQGKYSLPRRVRRCLKKRLSILALSGRPKLLVAVSQILTLIGRFHTAPRTFESRGCGLGPDGGFLLDRRGLSGPNRPEGCDGLTEWLVREATAFLIEIGFIERITDRALIAVEDKRGRFGLWLKAKKGRDGSIKAPPVRYRLTRFYRSLFLAALVQTNPGLRLRPPVCDYLDTNIYEGGVRTVGVSTGGDRAAQWAADRRAMFEELNRRKQRRLWGTPIPSAHAPAQTVSPSGRLDGLRLSREALGGFLGLP